MIRIYGASDDIVCVEGVNLSEGRTATSLVRRGLVRIAGDYVLLTDAGKSAVLGEKMKPFVQGGAS